MAGMESEEQAQQQTGSMPNADESNTDGANPQEGGDGDPPPDVSRTGDATTVSPTNPRNRLA